MTLKESFHEYKATVNKYNPKLVKMIEALEDSNLSKREMVQELEDLLRVICSAKDEE